MEQRVDDNAEVEAGGGDAEYRFRIDAYTPATIPMARLAEYMAQLAAVLGEPAAVHFDRLESGSTALVHRIEREAVPKVRFRTEGVRRGDAPRDALRAYRAINRLLREDNGVGTLTEPLSGVVLNFPGREGARDADTVVKQDGTVGGRLMRVGGVERQVPVVLLSEGEQIVGCYADHRLAKRLAGHLFEQVRLHGAGRWRRDADGVWTLDHFRIRSFQVLRDVTLATALAELGEVTPAFGPGAYEELGVIRHGPPGEGEPDGRD